MSAAPVDVDNARRVKPSTLQIVCRIAAGLLGGYAFVWGFATLVIALLLQAGMLFGDAQKLTFLLAFLVMLSVFCWSFVSASLVRVWVVLAGGGALMTGLAWLLTRAPASA